MTKFTLINHANQSTYIEDSRSNAEDRRQNGIEDFGFAAEDLEIVQGAIDDYSEYVDDLDTVGNQPASEGMSDGGTTAEVIDEPINDLPQNTDTNTLDELGDSLTADPLDVLPGYMITTVEGKPTLNKRGVSVLAFHYDVSVVDYEVVAHPHETEYEYCAMRFTVERDGKEYVGHGEAHAEEVDKSKLLRMAETRAYKRAVIFATGTGIIGYQEVMEELQ